MSKRADSAEAKSMADKPKLTRAERKQIEAVIRKYRGDGKPHTAQDTIPYQIMYPDGICYLGNRRYSQSIEFFDINYLLAQPDDQTAIFEYLCDLYNYLDSSIHVQFTYPNRKSDREQLARSFEMPPCNDGLDPIRQEQTDILEKRTQEHMKEFDLDFDEARKKALETVAVPGTSEHQIGLAVDIVGEEANAWLAEHCWEYGFILRYTEEKASITGITNEPWHFRYVGREISMDMKDSGLCLEEYLGAV